MPRRCSSGRSSSTGSTAAAACSSAGSSRRPSPMAPIIWKFRLMAPAVAPSAAVGMWAVRLRVISTGAAIRQITSTTSEGTTAQENTKEAW